MDATTPPRMQEWQDFSRGVPARYLSLPLTNYSFQVEFVEFNLDEKLMLQLTNQMASAAVAAVRGHPDCSLSALTQRSTVETPIAILFGHPVYDFQIQLTRTSFLIGKQDCTLEELFLTLPIIKSIARQLFGQESRTSLRPYPFLQWAFKSGHRFKLDCRVGQRLSDEDKSATNLDVMKQLLNVEDSGYLGAIAPEGVLRGDATISAVKTLANRRRILWITAQAPWNVTQRDLTLSFSMSTGDSPGETIGVADQDYEEFDVGITEFYRDMILQRVMPQLFNDISVTR